MNEKDKIITKSVGVTAIVSAATIVDNVLFKGTPLLSAAVSLSLGLFGSAAELRVNRAVDFISSIKENPEVFTETLVKTEEFQDAFAYTLEKYIRERNEKKRRIIKNIFQGYSTSIDKGEFELERMISILSLVSQKGLELLRILNQVSATKIQGNKLSDYLTTYLVNDSNNNPGKYNLASNPNIREIWADAEVDLISIGILKSYNAPNPWGVDPNNYDLTNTGREFIKYISS